VTLLTIAQACARSPRIARCAGRFTTPIARPLACKEPAATFNPVRKRYVPDTSAGESTRAPRCGAGSVRRL